MEKSHFVKPAGQKIFIRGCTTRYFVLSCIFLSIRFRQHVDVGKMLKYKMI